jgi:hypothetical protein
LLAEYGIDGAARPDAPGVYRMRDAGGGLLYVGKSRSLRTRLESWFGGYHQLPESKKKMIREVSRIETERVGSDLEALLVEEAAIRRENPRWNEQREVHGGEPRPGGESDQVLFLPAASDRFVRLCLLRSDGAILLYNARRNARRSDSLAGKMRSFFVERTGGSARSAWVIARRWLAAHRDSVTVLECSRYENIEELVAVVVLCLNDPSITAGDRLEFLPPPPE